MDNCIDIFPDELRAMGDYDKEASAPPVSKEHEFVDNLVKNNRVVVFSKSQCPHCDDSKTLLSNMGVNYKAVELDQLQEGSQVQNFLGQITNARTVSASIKHFDSNSLHLYVDDCKNYKLF